MGARSASQKPGVGRRSLFHESEYFFTLYDGMPKAAVHLLVVPKIPMDSALETQSEAFLEAYMQYLERILRILGRLFPEASFRHGVHAIPSLHQMHCHVVSQEFVPSDRRNRLTKDHWPSFQEPFLVPLWVIRKTLFPDGSESGPDHAALKVYLQQCGFDKKALTYFECPRCQETGSLGGAFDHLTACKAPLPLSWQVRDPDATVA